MLPKQYTSGITSRGSIRYLLLAGLLFIGLFFMGCQEDDPVDPDPQPTETAQAVIGPDGGTVELSNGIRVVIPPGALSQDREITLHNLKPGDYFDGPTDNSFVIECLPDGQALAKPAEIMFPVPDEWSGRTDIEGVAGYIDPGSGAVEVYPSTILSINNIAYLVIETTHFSRYTGAWYEYPPATAAILEIPHYNQGNTPYCWAAGLQMVCEAVKHDANQELFNIIGQVGVDESGIGQYTFRFGPSISSHVESRTGIAPDRKIWPIGSAPAMDGYLRDRIALGFPVLVFSPVEDHAFVVVGYDGLNFYLADPRSTAQPGLLNYQVKAWSDFKTDQMEFNAKFVTLSLPAAIQCADRLQTINVPSGGQFQFRPKPGNYQEAIRFVYDYQVPAGYSFRDIDNKRKDTIPGNMGELILEGIELANASRIQTATYTVQTKVLNLKEPTRSYTSSTKTITVGPNSMGTYGELIPVADFQNAEVSDYILSISAWDGSGNIDEAEIKFTLAPAEKTTRLGLTIQVNVEDHGDNVYSLPFHSGFPTDHDPAEIHGGRWQGNEYLIEWIYADGGTNINFTGRFTFDAARTKIISTNWHYIANGHDLLVFAASDIAVTFVNNTYLADLSGPVVCDKIIDIHFEEDVVNGDAILRYFCTEDAWLYIEIPK